MHAIWQAPARIDREPELSTEHCGTGMCRSPPEPSTVLQMTPETFREQFASDSEELRRSRSTVSQLATSSRDTHRI